MLVLHGTQVYPRTTRRHLKTYKKEQCLIIFPEINYHEALKICKHPTLSIRRDLDLLCKAFFFQVSKPEHKLNYLLEKRNEHSDSDSYSDG